MEFSRSYAHAILLGFIPFILALSGCQSDDDPTPRVQFAQLTDQEKLFVVEYLGLGSNYSEVKTFIPQMSALTGEFDGEVRFGLEEATGSVVAFGRTTSVEANFQYGALYAITFAMDALKPEEADSLFAHITETYVARLGEAFQESESDSLGQDITTNYWCWETNGVICWKVPALSTRSVGWANQKSCPLPNSPLQPTPAVGSRLGLGGVPLVAVAAERQVR